MFPKKSEINSAFYAFSKKEKIVFFTFVVTLVFSTLWILQTINRHFMVSVPMYGGSITEGIIGTPRFINPALASSDADQDMVSLIYSGLMRKNPDGSITPDLAENYEVSKDGLEYIFTLKNNLYFHDGKPVTADDVVFTIDKVKDSIIKSPRRANWEGITATKVDDKTIKFNLRQPYASFLENTTLGIMPAHIWNNSPIELNSQNTEPIGSGPYMISKVNKKESGIVDSYELKAFKNFALGKAYIKNINVYFYLNEDEAIKALGNKKIDQLGSVTPPNAELLEEKGYQTKTTTLPRIFGLFFNQNSNQLFIDKTIMKAIDQAIDKEKIVREVLSGYGVVINNTIPSNILEHPKTNPKSSASHEKILQQVSDMLSKNGWKKNASGFLEKSVTDKKKTTVTPLEFSISTSNAPDLAKTALLIQEDLQKIGMKVDIKTFEVGSLNQEVIRPRKYDVLLFGQIINNESDLFAFWHSSQRKDPGLNVSLYTNAKVDQILESAFVTSSKEERIKKYLQFEEEIKKDIPAIFLYSPDFIYITSKDLKGIGLNQIVSASNRFYDVHKWYLKEDNVWRVFAK